MKRFAILALALVLAAGLATTVFAQPSQYDVGVFSDLAGTNSVLTAPAFTPVNFYAVAFDLDNQVKGFELTLGVPVGFTVLSKVKAGPNPINVGDEANNEFIVGTGACVEAGPGPFVLVSMNGGFFTPTVPADATVCISGTTPSSFPNGTPGYLQCDNSLVPFGVAQNGEGRYPNACLVMNATSEGPVATEAASFGEMKARF
jgi:hypothetical protein